MCYTCPFLLWALSQTSCSLKACTSILYFQTVITVCVQPINMAPFSVMHTMTLMPLFINFIEIFSIYTNRNPQNRLTTEHLMHPWLIWYLIQYFLDPKPALCLQQWFLSTSANFSPGTPSRNYNLFGAQWNKKCYDCDARASHVYSMSTWK